MNICLIPSSKEQVTAVLTNNIPNELLLNVGREVACLILAVTAFLSACHLGKQFLLIVANVLIFGGVGGVEGNYGKNTKCYMAP